MDNSRLLLGIETSCDETAAAVVGKDEYGCAQILSNIVLSQIEEHEKFGGVVPEIAARAHLSTLSPVIERALTDARITINRLDAVAVTAGPGLAGGLLVGLMMAKGLARAGGLPLVCVNHLEGHALTARLTDGLSFPYLLLLISGGHTQIVSVRGLGDYERWASSIDDSLGETFDKTAKLLSLGFPGGPKVEKAALQGDENRFDFPQPMKGRDTLNMSFSGLKTAVRIKAHELAPLREQDIADICASFQGTVGAILVDRLERAMDQYEKQYDQSKHNLVVAGGVAANLYLRCQIEGLCKKHGWNLIAPPLKLCGDNGAMIAWAGLERFEKGFVSSMNFSPKSRWPLDEVSENLVGSGKKGAKV